MARPTCRLRRSPLSVSASFSGGGAASSVCARVRPVEAHRSAAAARATGKLKRLLEDGILATVHH
jgi:hypothetical protein